MATYTKASYLPAPAPCKAATTFNVPQKLPKSPGIRCFLEEDTTRCWNISDLISSLTKEQIN